ALVALPAAVVWLWALRRGERWPLAAPVLFAAGGAVALLPVAVSDAPLSLHQLLAPLWPTRAAPALTRAAALVVANQVGVVALLLAGIGCVVLATRAPVALLLLAFGGAAALRTAAPAAGLAEALLAAPVAVGIGHLAAKLGRAQLAAA